MKTRKKEVFIILSAITLLVISCIPFSSFAQQFRRVFVKMNNSSEKPHEIVYRKGHLLRIKDFEGKEDRLGR